MLEVAITQACENTGTIISDYTAGPVYMGNGTNGCHESSNLGSNQTTSIVLTERYFLRQINSDYDAKRYNDIVLKSSLRVRICADWYILRLDDETT